jgi:hypothetical protein
MGQSSAIAKAMNADLAVMKQELQALAVQLEQGQISSQDFAQAFTKLDGNIRQTTDLLGRLKGSGGGNSGQGLLGLSYAVQDFTSQLGTRGLVGALAAVQNNIPQILMSLGAGAGMTGIISVLAVGLGILLPAIQKAFGGETQEAIDKAKEKLKEFQEQVKKAHEEFIKFTQTPTEKQSESAENVKAILAERPAAERAAAAVAATATGKEIEAERSQGETAELGELNKADMTDELIELHAQRVNVNEMPRVRAELRAKRDAARQRRFEMDRAIRQRIGEKAVTQAQVAGPAGMGALRRVTQTLADSDRGFDRSIASQLQGVTPDALEQQDREDKEFQDQLDERSAAVQRRSANRDRLRTDQAEMKQWRDDVHKEQEGINKVRDDNAAKLQKQRQDDANEAAKERADTEKRLGDTWMAKAEQEMLTAGPQGQQRIRDKLTRSAQRQLMASGMPRDEAAMKAGGVQDMLTQDIVRQKQMMGVKGNRKGDEALYQMLSMMLQQQGQMAHQQGQMINSLKPMQHQIGQQVEKNRTASSMGFPN